MNGDGDKTDTSVSEANQISVSAIRRKLGFFDNNFLANADWVEPTNPMDSPKNDFDPITTGDQSGSSYVNNFVTPIQRRVIFNEYLMEVCPKIPAHSCEAGDWSVNGEKVLASQKKATGEIGNLFNASTHKAGTTAADRLATPDLRPYARRVAFARDTNPTSPTYRNLILDTQGQPVPLGIDGSGNIQAFPRNTVAGQTWTVGLPRTAAKALWFRTTEKTNGLPGNGDTNYGNDRHLFYQTINGTALNLAGADLKQQPLLVPVLQIHMPHDEWTDDNNANPGGDKDSLPSDKGFARERNWLVRATHTTTNLAIVAGDTPAAGNETNGGLENFVRYLEDWAIDKTKDPPKFNHNLSGSLIQYKRSAYASAPWQILRQNRGASIFGSDYPQLYQTNTSSGTTPFYTPPSRQWGFDVGLLSQLPDLFAQTFTLPPTTVSLTSSLEK